MRNLDIPTQVLYRCHFVCAIDLKHIVCIITSSEFLQNSHVIVRWNFTRYSFGARVVVYIVNENLEINLEVVLKWYISNVIPKCEPKPPLLFESYCVVQYVHNHYDMCAWYVQLCLLAFNES